MRSMGWKLHSEVRTEAVRKGQHLHKFTQTPTITEPHVHTGAEFRQGGSPSKDQDPRNCTSHQQTPLGTTHTH